MVGLYGQILPATGWTATAFESIGDDDPADHEPRFDQGLFDNDSFDPDWMENDYFAVQPSLYEHSIYVEGRLIPREELYEQDGHSP